MAYERTITDRIARRIAYFGTFLAGMGVLSSIITWFGCEVRQLRGLENADPVKAWGFRLGLVVVGGVIYFVANRFDKGNSAEVVAADAAEAAETRARARQATMSHPRMAQVLASLGSRGPIVWEPTGNPAEYVIRGVVWQDAQYRDQGAGAAWWYGPDDPAVTNVAVYLERTSPPERMVSTHDFTTGAIAWQDAHPGTWAHYANR